LHVFAINAISIQFLWENATNAKSMQVQRKGQ
jgi:hypothetical protein